MAKVEYAQHAFSQSDDDTQKIRDSSRFSAKDPLIDISTNQDTESDFDLDLERTEWNVSVGYAFTDHFAIYAGYKRTDTNFEEKVRGNFTSSGFGSAIVKGNTANANTVNIELSEKGNFTNDTEIEFDQDGPFVGATFGIPLRRWIFDGLLSFNAAVAFLDGEVTQRAKNFRGNFTTTTTAFFNGQRIPIIEDTPSQLQRPNTTAIVEGDTVGFSLGVNWRGFTPIKRLSYIFSIDGHRYDFSGDPGTIRNEQTGEVSNIEAIDFDEFSISFRAGFSYAF